MEAMLIILLWVPWQGMVICALLIGGFYPLTQIYQHQQDLDDGVATSVINWDITALLFFAQLFIYLPGYSWHNSLSVRVKEDKLLLVSIFFVPVIVYFIKWFMEVRKNSKAANFKNTMKMNWIAAICTNTAFIILLIWKYFE